MKRVIFYWITKWYLLWLDKIGPWMNACMDVCMHAYDGIIMPITLDLTYACFDILSQSIGMHYEFDPGREGCFTT